MRNPRILLFLSLLLVTFSKSYSQSGTALPFLMINPSPTATAMGDIGAAFNTDDAFNIALNPAHIGGLSREHNLSASVLIGDDYFYDKSDIGLQFGMDLSKLTGLPLHAGIGILSQKIDLGEFTRTGADGHVIGKFKADESGNAIAIGASIDYFVEISVGLTYKFLNSTLTPSNDNGFIGNAKAGAFDAGILFSIPVLDNVTIVGDLNTVIKANAGFALMNMGSEIEFGDEKDPLPYYGRLGYSITADLKLPVNNIEFSILQIDWTADTKEYLVNRDSLSFSYRSPFSQMNLPENLILLNRKDNNVQVGYGIRLTAFETISYMTGNYENNLVNFSSSGIGISSKGILKFLSSSMDDDILKFISNYFEISFINSNVPNYFSSTANITTVNLKINNINL